MSFTKHFAFFFLLLLLITLLDFFYLGKPAIGIDDANIFMNYARHLANGDGFVFNTNGEKVEGFTSLLWVLICAGFYLFSSKPELLIMAFSLLLSSLTVTLVYEEVKKDVGIINTTVSKKYFFWIYSAFILCIGPSFVTWSVLSLMENSLWTFLFTACIILILQLYRNASISKLKRTGLVLAGMLLILTRPEALAWGLFFSVVLAFAAWKNRTSFLYPALFFAALVCTIATLSYFRQQYFGYPLPNTYYAKVSHNSMYNIKEGFKYAIGFVTNYHALISFLFAVLLALCFSNLKRLKLFQRNTEAISATDKVVLRICIVTAVIVLAILLPLSTGGDHFGGYRFYQGIILLFAWGIAAFGLLYKDLGRLAKKGVVAFGSAIALFILFITAGTLYSVKNSAKTQLNYEFQLASDGRAIADELNNVWPQQRPAVGVIAVGGFALNYQGTTVDLMGLNNTLMGHSKGDRVGIKNHAAFNKDVFYQLQADLILPKMVAGEREAKMKYVDLLNTSNFENQAMKNIFNDTVFQQQYQPVVITKDGKHIFSFANSTLLNSMQNDSTRLITRIGL